MIQYLLDTDHVTLHELGHPPILARIAALPPDAVGVSIVTVEETVRGRLAVLAKRSKGEARVRAYAKLRESIQFFNSVPVVAFDTACEDRFQILLPHKLRIGTQDLRIAATALVNNLIVVTRNRRHFERVPGLLIEDWSGD